jgi:hypothetical protein
MLLGILIVVALVWLVIVLAAHLPLWLLLVLIVLAVIAFADRGRAV